jgi:hypothetical protein
LCAMTVFGPSTTILSSGMPGVCLVFGATAQLDAHSSLIFLLFLKHTRVEGRLQQGPRRCGGGGSARVMVCKGRSLVVESTAGLSVCEGTL